jgi:hypothetical protein
MQQHCYDQQAARLARLCLNGQSQRVEDHHRWRFYLCVCYHSCLPCVLLDQRAAWDPIAGSAGGGSAETTLRNRPGPESRGRDGASGTDGILEPALLRLPGGGKLNISDRDGELTLGTGAWAMHS